MYIYTYVSTNLHIYMHAYIHTYILKLCIYKYMFIFVLGEGDNIHIKRCFVRGDEDEISDLVEEWRYVYTLKMCIDINIYLQIGICVYTCTH